MKPAMGKPGVEVYSRMLGCYLPYILLGLVYVGWVRRSFWLAGPLVFLYVVIPVLDALFDKDLASLDPADFSRTQAFVCRLSPYGFVAGYIALLALYVLGVGNFKRLDFVLALASMGAVASIAITASHELIHKRSRLAKLFARAGLLAVAYMHFEYTHLRGHHRDAATRKDNHTGWYNERFPDYLVRTTKDGLGFVSDFEKARLERIGVKFISLQNRFLVFVVCPLLVMIVIVVSKGASAVLFFVGQAIIAIVSLEAVSYIEHYALLRDSKDGRAEAMDERHSWDCYRRFSGYVTFMLQRHADHHRTSSKDFFLLRTNNASPELPVGYPLLVLLVASPKHWSRLIHPLIRWR